MYVDMFGDTKAVRSQSNKQRNKKNT